MEKGTSGLELFSHMKSSESDSLETKKKLTSDAHCEANQINQDKKS
jgi:hypothetical protein